MTTLLEQAFTAVSALPQTEQDKIAELIFREIERLQTPKKPSILKPVTKGRGYTDTSINHDAVLVEFIYTNKVSQQSR